ncbi:MAG: hypothetical protein IT534_10360 [Bauldia sp.]|nr:hypothetical protein [Bauldia sp.]
MARRYRRPASWVDVSDPLRLLCYFEALRSKGTVFAFSLRLRHDIEALARSQPVPIHWLQRRVAHHLKVQLGRTVDFFFVLEEADDQSRALHLHGVLGVTDNEIARARKALRTAAGEWAEARQHQCQTTPNPDAGWITYLSKTHVWHRPFVRRLFEITGSTFKPRFEGPWTTATKSVHNAGADVWRAATGRSGGSCD